MLKKTIKYVDYNGESRAETFFFNLTKAELTRLNFDKKDDLATRIKQMVNSDDRKAILQLFEDLITAAYGRPSEDGRYFRKSEAMREEFMSCPAYDELFFELVSDADKFVTFMKALVPKDLAQEIEKQEANNALDHNTGAAIVE